MDISFLCLCRRRPPPPEGSAAALPPLGDSRAGFGESAIKPPMAAKTHCFPAAFSEKEAWNNRNDHQWGSR